MTAVPFLGLLSCGYLSLFYHIQRLIQRFLKEIDAAVDVFRKADCPFELMHCNSTYPMKNEYANLAVIDVLRERYHCPVGYSGHETGRIVPFAAAA